MTRGSYTINLFCFWSQATGVGGAQPALLHAYTDVSHGSACRWGSRPESTYANNRYLTCAYASPGAVATTCHPDARPAEVCAGSGEACPQCGGPECACPSLQLAAGAHVSLRAASRSFYRAVGVSLSLSHTLVQPRPR